jgi:molybdate-binding protein/DNA-binding transcriptional regulator YhcF (GntR family)
MVILDGMDDSALYRQIAETLRQEILAGKLKPGDRLPSVRSLAEKMGCTVGTIQHAYRELARQGLVSSRPGKGTIVARGNAISESQVLRKANLVNRAEAFLLEGLTAGYAPEEIENAVLTALDRWRVLAVESEPSKKDEIRFVGSHDLAVTWLAAHFQEICPECRLQLSFSGSLGGLMALVDGNADLAGSHIWDPTSGNYNEPIVRRLFPGKPMVLVTLAHRALGWIISPGNPKNIQAVPDLLQKDLRFINRRAGSGTRIRLDGLIHAAGISGENIPGYHTEVETHSQVARAVAERQVDAGFGLGAAAAVYGLEFLPVVRERYDLVMGEDVFELSPTKKMYEFICSASFKAVLKGLAGYDAAETGKVHQIG